ncbi:MAG: penicillin-binding protein 1C [Thermoanaerobaculia bacterium]
MVGLFVAIAIYIRCGPIDETLLDPSRFSSPTVVDRNGVVLYEPLTKSGLRGQQLKDIPPNVQKATIAAEDRRFFHHLGIDPIAIARAGWRDLLTLSRAEGGSTITQQTAKLLLDNNGRTLANKAQEAVLALRLEHRYTKTAILKLYLSIAPYGNQIAGVRRASLRYFGCEPENLTIAQSAFLASLPRRPSATTKVQWKYVVDRMEAEHLISADEARIARAERLRFMNGEQKTIAQHFVERVLAEPHHEHRIATSLDASLQREVGGIIAAQKQNLLRHNARSVAVLVVDNRSGEILAYEGSGDYFGSTFGGAIDGVTTLRQPGSALKPFTYALAFENGFTPATVLADIPSHFATAEEGVVYTPRNYDGKYRGPLRARLALAGSENVPAVAVAEKLGPPTLLRFLRRAGFSNLDRTADYYGLGLTLGDAEVTLEQLVRAYAMLARGGVTVDGRRLVSQRSVFWITDILSDAAAREYVFGSGGSLDFPFPVAAKTGTSQAYRDNWTVGYTREVTVGVWVGNFGREELRNSTGVTGAGPIFHDVMLAAMKHRAADTIMSAPADLEKVEICALSGLRPSPWCPAIEREWVRRDAPVEFCSWHHKDSVRLPSEYAAWKGGAPAPSPALHVKSIRLKIQSPPNGATYLIDPTLRMEYQTLPLRAAAQGRVQWHIDGNPVKTSEWSLVPGRHTITAKDGSGNRDEVRIYVK